VRPPLPDVKKEKWARVVKLSGAKAD